MKDNNNPFISLIIPVFNTEQYLKECLESVTKQTLTNIEIICVNDGSTDNSQKILEDFAQNDNRIKIISQENKGQSSARNMGLKCATGEYIAFLDSDDFLELNMLETLYNKAKENDTDITMCSINFINEAKKTSTKHDCYHSLDILPTPLDNQVFDYKKIKDIIFNICVTPWNKIYKSSFLQQNNLKFKENLNFEDIVFFLETIILAKRINFVRDCLINYRYFSKTSYSTGDYKTDYKKLDFFKVFKYMEKFLKSKNLYKEFKKDFLTHKKNSLIYWFDKIKDDKTKQIYKNKLCMLYPDLIFREFIEKVQHKTIVFKLNHLIKSKKVFFRGASIALEQILQDTQLKNKENILGIIDKNPDKIGNYCANIKITDYSILSQYEDTNYSLILSVKNIYNFEKLVKQELSELGIKNIKIINNIF